MSWQIYHRFLTDSALCELECGVISQTFVADSFLQPIFVDIYFNKVQKCLDPALGLQVWLP